MKTFIIALLASFSVASSQTIIEEFTTPLCDKVSLAAPMNTKRDKVRSLMLSNGFALQTSSTYVDAYHSKKINTTIHVQFDKGVSCGVYAVIYQDNDSLATSMANSIRETMQRSHGEADPKLHWWWRKCGDRTYSVRMYVGKVEKKNYVSLSIVKEK